MELLETLFSTLRPKSVHGGNLEAGVTIVWAINPLSGANSREEIAKKGEAGI